MYRGANRQRGGRTQSYRGRGAKQPRLHRNDIEGRTRQEIPKATPAHLLPDPKAKADDDTRVLNEWMSYYEDLFKTNPPTIFTPVNTHMVPGSDELKPKLLATIEEARVKFKDDIMSHLREKKREAVEKANSAPSTSGSSITIPDLVAKLSQDADFQQMITFISASTTSRMITNPAEGRKEAEPKPDQQQE